MTHTREDRIYDLQQALASLPASAWEEFLNARCMGDPVLAAEVLARQMDSQAAGPTVRRLRLSIGKPSAPKPPFPGTH